MRAAGRAERFAAADMTLVCDWRHCFVSQMHAGSKRFMLTHGQEDMQTSVLGKAQAVESQWAQMKQS